MIHVEVQYTRELPIATTEILALFKSNEVVTSIPFRPSGGDLFVLSTENPLKIDDWKVDGYTVKPAVAVTSIKRDPPLSGHFWVPRTILNANAPLLSVHLSNAASGRRNLPQNAEIVSINGHFPWFDAAV